MSLSIKAEAELQRQIPARDLQLQIPARAGLVGVLALSALVLAAVLGLHPPADDAVAYTLAGRMAIEGHTLLYPGSPDYAEFVQRFTESTGKTDVSPWVSLPWALPLAALLPSVWFIQVLDVLAVSALLVSAFRNASDEPKRWRVVLAGLVVLPFLACTLCIGTMAPVFAWAATRARARQAWPRVQAAIGAGLAVATAFKLWPLLVLVLLVWRREWRSVAWFAGTTLALVVVSLAWLGWPVYLSAMWGLRVFAATDHGSWAPLGVSALRPVVFLATCWVTRNRRSDVDLGLWWSTAALCAPLTWLSYFWFLLPSLVGSRWGWVAWAAPSVLFLPVALGVPGAAVLATMSLYAVHIVILTRRGDAAR